VVAPLGEKASPLEKDKASGASKDWSLCPLELIQALLELLHAPLQLIWAPLELPKTLTMPFFLKYNVFGPIILDYAPGEFFCWHLYAWRKGRILIMPAVDLKHKFLHYLTKQQFLHQAQKKAS